MTIVLHRSQKGKVARVSATARVEAVGGHQLRAMRIEPPTYLSTTIAITAAAANNNSNNNNNNSNNNMTTNRNDS
eukprot:172893-Amphidinium_carterae.1